MIFVLFVHEICAGISGINFSEISEQLQLCASQAPTANGNTTSDQINVQQNSQALQDPFAQFY